MKTVHVIEICSAPEPVISENIERLRVAGLDVTHKLLDDSVVHRLEPTGIARRASLLNQALLDNDVDCVIAARGGYGASDLLPQLDWEALLRVAPKLLVGFSDVGAVQSALYARLGWPALHAPMPGSSAWCGDAAVDELVSMLVTGPPLSGTIGVQCLARSPHTGTIHGTLFGGCLSVLTNLIGTPDLPDPAPGRILFLEDVNESAERILRYWNQWCASGQLAGTAAVVLGRFAGMTGKTPVSWLAARVAERTECPIFVSEDFGHGQPNHPIAIGGMATIQGDALNWQLAL